MTTKRTSLLIGLILAFAGASADWKHIIFETNSDLSSTSLPKRSGSAPGASSPIALAEWPTRWGAAGSLVLLALFVVGLTRSLRRGEAPDCHCFGQLHSKPASWVTVARNLVLALPAVYVVLAGPGSNSTLLRG